MKEKGLLIKQAKARKGMKEMSEWLDLNHDVVKKVLATDPHTRLTQRDVALLWENITVMYRALEWLMHYHEELRVAVKLMEGEL